MNSKIGVFDSGKGGLTTLNEIKKILPNEDYIYYADSSNNPYGNKTDEALYNIVTNVVNKLISKGVKLVVIACNTATTKCIEKLRKDYPNMLFIGTEPAIKVACDNNYKNTLVLATPGTINSERTQELIEKNKRKNQNIYLLPCEGLANAIELNDNDKINKLLDKYLNEYTNKNIDSIVLGCTHYPIISEKIQIMFPDAKLIDGNLGVAKRVKYILEENNLLNTKKENGTIEFIISKLDSIK
ncbi:MAG: glutamate racemase [Bacilli bacterium]|nr:glutamate racemase [Bacilli bacterium]